MVNALSALPVRDAISHFFSPAVAKATITISNMAVFEYHTSIGFNALDSSWAR